ncbi:MAG: DUF1178 family protein [Pseudomonadota bacterium]
MILYALHCNNDHQFEAWFKSSSDYDSQSERGLIVCPICESNNVSKSLMAPSVRTSRNRASAPVIEHEPTAQADATGQSGSDASVPVAAPSPALANSDQKAAQFLETLRALKQHVTENADYVGRDFAEEARRIHYGEAEERGIYGESSLEEAGGLLEEGIDVHLLPILPEEKN